jgi:hypothetical protein
MVRSRTARPSRPRSDPCRRQIAAPPPLNRRRPASRRLPASSAAPSSPAAAPPSSDAPPYLPPPLPSTFWWVGRCHHHQRRRRQRPGRGRRGEERGRGRWISSGAVRGGATQEGERGERVAWGSGSGQVLPGRTHQIGSLSASRRGQLS